MLEDIEVGESGGSEGIVELVTGVDWAGHECPEDSEDCDLVGTRDIMEVFDTACCNSPSR